MRAQEQVVLHFAVGILIVYFSKVLYVPSFVFASFTFLAHCVLLCYVVVIVGDLLSKHVITWRIDVKNKAVVITGCDSGFGKALAQRLDGIGFKVFACCLDPKSEGALDLRLFGSDRMQVVGMDVTNDASVSRALAFVKDSLGSFELWALVNNAGACKTFLVEMTPLEAHNLCYQVNALGMVRATRAFLPLLRKSQGRVVNVCSMAGRLPAKFSCAYTMSKFAAVAFTESLNLELQEFGVLAISIEPEYFKTYMCSNENIRNITQSCIDNTDRTVIEDYGKEYTEKSQECFIDVNASACEDLHLVVDAMERAVADRWPMRVYAPCRSFFTEAMLYGLIRFNTEVRLVLAHIFFSVLGLKKPRTAKDPFSETFYKHCFNAIKRLSGLH